MNKQNFDVWGRTLELEIVYDCYRGEVVSEDQKRAYELFCEKASSLFSVAKVQAEQYVLSNNKAEIEGGTITNIFKYVKPKAVYIKRTNKNVRKVAILCAYKFNPDDGIAIVFENEDFCQIGTENIIL